MGWFDKWFRPKTKRNQLNWENFDFGLSPILAISVYNRYFELVNTLKIFNELRHEFPVDPTILIIWARPDEDRKWVFDVLKSNNLLHCLIPRPTLHGESLNGTSYPETFNIRLALEFAQVNFKNSYVIYQTADSFFRPGLYSFMNNAISNGANLVTTGVDDKGSWLSTSAFAIRTNSKEYWPPHLDLANPEVVEFLWKKQLGGRKIQYYQNTEYFGYLTSHDFEHQKEILRKIKSEIQ